MSTGPWTFDGSIASLGAPGDVVTLVDETTFCLSTRAGDIQPGSPQGLVLLDTRFVSQLVLRVNGFLLEPLAVAVEEPFHATFYGRVSPPGSEPDVPLVVVRSRSIGRGLVERIRLENHGLEPLEATVSVEMHADFADLFEVKEQRAVASRIHRLEALESALRVVGEREGRERSSTFRTSPPAELELRGSSGLATWTVRLAPQGAFEVCIEVECGVEGEPIEPRHRCGEDHRTSEPGRRLGAWRSEVPTLRTDDDRLLNAVQRGAEDLGALRIIDPDHPDDPVVAAGAPWFMALFGRDSLLSSYMALVVDPDLALGVLRTLARLQGDRVDDDTEEEPGRIIHELRFDRRPSWHFADATRYYGTIDATPLFVVLLGELRRWGVTDGAVEDLLPAADAALAWITDFGDRDGDGYVEYERASPHGLANQGWKDSWDAIRHADGRLAEGPIALCEVQGYTYAAYLARAFFAEERGDTATCAALRSRAAELRRAFNRDFWVEDGGFIALALDGDKRRVEAVASNMGHCLWSGIVDLDHAEQVADRLLQPDMFSGWGVRTLASSMPAYNPVSYHNGSVWPHDNALIVAGLMRYGFVEHAHRIIDGLLDVTTHHDGRLPELLAGTDRATLSVPAAYPTSCMPQAWAAATPLVLLRALLRLDPWLGHDQVWLDPALLDGFSEIHVEGVRLGGRRVTIDADGTVTGLAPDIELHTVPRSPLPRPTD